MDHVSAEVPLDMEIYSEIFFKIMKMNEKYKNFTTSQKQILEEK